MGLGAPIGEPPGGPPGVMPPLGVVPPGEGRLGPPGIPLGASRAGLGPSPAREGLGAIPPISGPPANLGASREGEGLEGVNVGPSLVSPPGEVGSAGVGASVAAGSGTGGKPVPGPFMGVAPPGAVPSVVCAGLLGLGEVTSGAGGKPGIVAGPPSWARAGVGAPSSGVGDVPPSTGFTFGAKGDFVTRNFGALPGLGGSPVFGVNFREGIGGV